MKILRLTSILLFLILGYSVLFAQNGFQAGKIITIDGDTIDGFIKSASDAKFNKECQFKLQKDAQVLIYTPENLKAFIIDNDLRKFERGRFPLVSRNVFFEVLCEGNINLYYLDDNVLHYFVKKKGDIVLHSLPYKRLERYVDNGRTKRFKTIETTDHIDTLKMVMKDMPSLYPDIERIQIPEKKNLIAIVSKYNLNAFKSQNNQKTKATISNLVLLRKGKMNLYVRTDSLSTHHFYIKKESITRIIELPFDIMNDVNYKGLLIHSYLNYSTSHIDTLKKYMADALPLFPSIEEIKIPTKTKLQKLIDEYNSYSDEKTYVQKHTLKRHSLNIDLVPGFNFVIASLSNHAVKFGSFIDVGFVQSNKHFFLKSGLFVYDGFTPLTDLYYAPTVDGIINEYYPPATTFLIPLQCEYRFSGKTIQPTLSFGYNLYLFDEIKPYNISLLPVISPGIKLQLGQRFSLSLHLELEFKNETLIAYLPETFNKAGLFFGLQVNL